MPGIELLTLLLVLVPCALHDLTTETIPPRLLAPLAGLVTGMVWFAGVRWWWVSALLGFAVFALAGLPWGDRLAVVLAAGLLPWPAVGLALGLALGVALWLILGVGRSRSVIGVPFFPLVAASFTVVACWTRWAIQP